MSNFNYISIGIPIYNAESFLANAITSVINQTYPYWELILIDDGSTDNSLSIAKEFENLDKRIRVISDGANKKLPFRLNQLILESRYEYIARMDADDIMFPHRLEYQVRFLEENEDYDLVSSGMVSIDANNNVMGFRTIATIISKIDKVELSYPILHPSIMARKKWCLRNLYSNKFPRAEDYELWSRAILNKDMNIAILPDLLMFYREEGNLSFEKILQSYVQVQSIYFQYTGSYSGVFKIEIKKILLRVFNFFGWLQTLAKRRNKKFLLDEDKANYQKVLNDVVKF